jgi:hypothetical protein
LVQPIAKADKQNQKRKRNLKKEKWQQRIEPAGREQKEEVNDGCSSLALSRMFLQ